MPMSRMMIGYSILGYSVWEGLGFSVDMSWAQAAPPTCFLNAYRGSVSQNARGLVRYRNHEVARIVAKMRSYPRGGMLNGRLLSPEAFIVLQNLKIERDNPEALDKVLKMQVSRLLEEDLTETFSELRRQNETKLTLKVFDIMRKEDWYKPKALAYRALMYSSWKDGLVDQLGRLFQELKEDGLRPNMLVYSELIRYYSKLEKPDKAMDIYREAKLSRRGKLNELGDVTFKALIGMLEENNLGDLAAEVKADFAVAFLWRKRR